MGSVIECFWLIPTELARHDLRRYEFYDYAAHPGEARVPTCPSNRMHFHDATVVLEGEMMYPMGERGRLGEDRKVPIRRVDGTVHTDISREDPRWPRTCEACDYVFREEDHWQHNVNRLFSGAPDGKLYTTRDMPAGAMYDATWWDVKGPDGITLAVVLPPGGQNVWHPDSPSTDGKPWIRTGTIPKVTCTPSVLTPSYHGFLTDGVLREC